VVAVLALLVLGCAAVIHQAQPHRSRHDDRTATSAGSAAPPVAAPGALTGALTPAQSAGIASDIASLTAAPAVAPATSSRYPAITVPAKSQPDLYARHLATRLLTQDYRTSRADLLAWVQSESVQSSEPRVVGLVPAELRPKLAVYSVTQALDGSAVPVPSQRDWAQWAARRAFTTVTIQKVVEPLKWSEAVASGELVDPGITAREIDAVVVTHWTERGTHKSSTHSIALSLSLEGPPARSGYGFVTAVTYQSVTVS
jgi:Xaa-Pro aminopeptidase